MDTFFQLKNNHKEHFTLFPQKILKKNVKFQINMRSKGSDHSVIKFAKFKIL